MYFVLAPGLFPGLGYLNVRAKMTAVLGGLGCRPRRRRRCGTCAGGSVSPRSKALFEVLAGPAAQPSTPGVRSSRFRTVAFDGCTSVKVPDTKRNRARLGKMKAALGVTGYPAVELMTLAETGTRALTAVLVRSSSDSSLPRWAATRAARESGSGVASISPTWRNGMPSSRSRWMI